ncbi:YigZ family protein [Thalassotalea agarivorans]|uniref:Uncharacterized protein, YigZ family n=1 Tax=Thalassotalea agarivorans TaxID=349064 RepID=A0A1I0GEY0_THASX|nr:YigZ family protein [Thalassotalea agarivorans]SET68829.1 uncharacterized protein, YigZ family [Thalassotalea agarivorans]
MSAYSVPATALIDETIVNKSRFICYIEHVTSPNEAKTFIESIQQAHPTASHHCYAFVAGAPNNTQVYGFSDDGEPSGTAGKPMFAVVQGSGLGELCAVVVRYFGGVKLGTGGLQRAYGGSVKEALAKLPTKVKIPMVHRSLACQYTQINDIQRIVESLDGAIISQTFAESIDLVVEIPLANETAFCEKITNVSAGQIQLKETR